MPKWTLEQQKAINTEGSNIIVSAGAGSGKTAVLTARVINKIKNGIHVNELLILTFTNNAAAEMKTRIKKAILEDEEIKKEAKLVESSSITTFDAFVLSLVKKYHYLLNLDQNISIIDSSIINNQKKNSINEIFNELYLENNQNFIDFVTTFCGKNDKPIKKIILSLDSKIDLLINKEEYLKNYINDYYSEENINFLFNEYVNNLLKRIATIKTSLYNLSFEVPEKFFNNYSQALTPLINAKTYDEIRNNLDIGSFRLTGSTENGKYYKSEITNIIKVLKSYTFYDKEVLINDLKSTKNYAEIIIDILLKLNYKVSSFKRKYQMFEFNDISKMAIRILEENDNVCIELKEYLNEILVDEYQDTSDLQEKFISLIENNNVYMVGDIKQSIYRFRNANPYIFKNKYDNYSLNNGGYKIDLNKNFRSRKETLDDINVIFNIVMDDFIGGADYKSSHQMIFGNNLYLENDMDSQNNNLEIYNYEYDKDFGYSKEEIECFAVANDIKNKIKNNYMIFDKDTSKLRNIRYSDFVILMDRATQFDLYKRIFEYLSIPLTKYTDTSVTDSNDVLILKNIIGLIIKYNKSEFDIDFKYALASISRSYLFRLSDNDIFDIIENNLLNNKIIDIVKDIANQYESLSISAIVDLIIEKFNFYDNLIKVGNVKASSIRLEYMHNLALNSENVNYTIEDFYLYLSKVIDDNFDIKVSMKEDSGDSVKIMTIHKSKGLEYPICYYTGIYKTFNVSDTKDRFLFDNDLGIITPYFKEGICKTIYSQLFKEKYFKEEISEKIRLFYVALTRCREKMIVVAPLEDKTMTSSEQRLNYKSFLDILNSVYLSIEKYITNISLSDIGLTKDYDFSIKIDYNKELTTDVRKIEFVSNEIDNSNVEQSKYSKVINKLIASDERSKMAIGNEFHHILEMIDFKNPNLDDVDENYKKFIYKFLNIGLDFLNCTIYKELEFVYNKDCNNTHGVIDLMLEYDNEIKIIDYKLSNTEDEAYLAQLNGYKSYISTRTTKPIKIYLYSIIKGELKEL